MEKSPKRKRTTQLSPPLEPISREEFVREAFQLLNLKEQKATLSSLIHQQPQHILSSLSCEILPLLKRDFLGQLPFELCYKIIDYLDLKTVVELMKVNSNYYNLINSNDAEFSIWKKRLINDRFSEGSLDYKSMYKYHYETRKNWLLGKHRRISFPSHGSNVITCLSFDDDRIVTGSDDETIHIYDINNGSLIKKLVGHQGGVWALQYHNNTLVSGSTDRTVRVWDMITGKCWYVFEGHTSTVRCLQIILPFTYKDGTVFPPRPLIVTGSRDRTMRVWVLPEDRNSKFVEAADNPFLQAVFLGHTDSVRAIAGCGRTLISGSYDCTVRLWSLETNTCIHVFRDHQEKVYSVGYCEELRRAVSGSMDSTVKVWDVDTKELLFNLEGHSSLVGLLELTPKYLISAAADSTLRIWNPVTGKCLAELVGHENAITCFHYDIVGNRVVSGSDGGVKGWELDSNGYGNLSATDLSGVIPRSCPLYGKLAFAQSADGVRGMNGRFLRDVVVGVHGVWRVKMDERRLICAVQTAEFKTFIEVLDFGAGQPSEVIMGFGDGGMTGQFEDILMEH